jgi:hypothetical protein
VLFALFFSPTTKDAPAVSDELIENDIRPRSRIQSEAELHIEAFGCDALGYEREGQSMPDKEESLILMERNEVWSAHRGRRKAIPGKLLTAELMRSESAAEVLKKIGS